MMMASVSEAHRKFLENVQVDLKNLSNEAKKKYPALREACDDAVLKVREGLCNRDVTLHHLSAYILYPLVQGCETKEPKIAKQCLGTIQRLILQQAVDTKGCGYITETLWNLMKSNVEEVKLLQTVTLLLTTNCVALAETLAKALAVCFRLCFCRDSTIMNTAGATVRQLVSLVFERVVVEDSKHPPQKETPAGLMDALKMSSAAPPKTLRPSAADAYLLFQDLVQLVNGDQPFWLAGLTEMTRTFGLDLIESLLTSFPAVFYNHPEFTFLLKERVCAMAIRLFSPNVKSRGAGGSSAMATATVSPSVGAQEKPYFPISMRLLRVVSVLIQKYYQLLVMECEIFLSLLVRFLDHDRPCWQRALALEVIHRLCIQQDIIVSFCTSYDMRPQSTKIVQDIVNSLDSYVHSLFYRESPNSSAGSMPVQVQPPAMLVGLPMGPGVTPMPAFICHGVWIPLSVTMAPGTAKSTFMEMAERIDPPPIPEGYGLSLAYACMLEVVRSLSLIVAERLGIFADDPVPAAKRPPGSHERCSPPAEADTSEEAGGRPASIVLAAVGADDDGSSEEERDRMLCSQLLGSTWCGLLATFSLLLDSSTDEAATESILKSMQCVAHLSGRLSLDAPRDAFITAVCKASLPPHYALTVLQPSSCTRAAADAEGGSSTYRPSTADSVPAVDPSAQRHQVVAVGTALPTSSLPAAAHHGPVMLTSKNLQCMRGLLSLAHCHGPILDTTWHLVLTTLQHLVWILGLKPSAGGSLRSAAVGSAAAAPPGDATAAVLTTAVLADLPVLSAMLSRLFESSRLLDDVALHHLIDALNRLNRESMELSLTNREPSLFAVAKLLETGLVNLDRVSVFWRPLTSHLLDACQHPHLRMREWGAEAITSLTRAALQHSYPVPLKSDQKLQTLLLTPLLELSAGSAATAGGGFPDVRLRQLDCTLQILQSCGERLVHGWPLVLDIIGAVDQRHSDQLVRLAFQCLQLVVTDFLPVMPSCCLPHCVHTVARFGSQTQEVNISLTAIGLMWNISDHFFQNRERLRCSLSADAGALPAFPNVTSMTPFDRLWMCLFTRLGDMCVDPRPAVRKSAGQTLFSTIGAHGSLLEHGTWQAVLWQVLFPVLDKVRTVSGSASTEKVDDGGNILIHHTRNTAHKQWAETQVLTLSGVARVFRQKRGLLCQLSDFQRAWALLLEFVQTAALNENSEVSLAALKSFQDVVDTDKGSPAAEAYPVDPCDYDSTANWDVVWKVWCSIGSGVTGGLRSESGPDADMLDPLVPTQSFLTALVLLFPGVFAHIGDRFSGADFGVLCAVLTGCVLAPTNADTQYVVLPSFSEVVISTLQLAVLEALIAVEKQSLLDSDGSQLLCPLCDQLLQFAGFGCRLQQGLPPTRRTSTAAGIVAVSYVPFAEKALTQAVSLYRRTSQTTIVIESNVLEAFIKCLEVPLSMKYECPAQTTWRLAVRSLLDVLQPGLIVLRQHRQHGQTVWSRLANALQTFLFSHSEPPSSCTVDELQADEALDCAVVRLIREDILPYAAVIPNQFLVSTMVMLNKGSLHSEDHEQLARGSVRLREDFANTCFDTLLHFSLHCSSSSRRQSANFSDDVMSSTDDVTAQLAVAALVHRFREVLVRFAADSRVTGKCPLARHRTSEISFVLKAITTLLVSLRTAADTSAVDTVTWQQLIELYPPLVECTLLACENISRPLRDALLEFAHFLHPAAPLRPGANGINT